MKRIGNFLFVQQWFGDANPTQAIINIDAITCITAHEIAAKERTVIEVDTEQRIALTGDHDDNIIELSKLLNYE